MRPVDKYPGIFKYRSKGTDRYCVRWSVRGEDRKRRGFPTLELARRYQAKVHLRKITARHLPEQMDVPWAEAVDLYWSAFKSKGRVDRIRPEGIIDQHLAPHFGRHHLHQLTPKDGLDYVKKRQAAGAAAGTIRREWQVLMRILNLAERYDLIPKNRLAAVELPDPAPRERTASPAELKALYDLGTPDLWRIVTLELLTGLRESPLLFLDGKRVHQRADGRWLHFGAGASPLKRLPRETPLSTAAWSAILGEEKNAPAGRIFTHWNRVRQFERFWSETCDLAGIPDLRFHDLRHTFATRLQDLGVDYEVRQALLGHRMPGMTAHYSHGGPGWRKKLREAVTRLERAFPLPHWAQAGSKRPMMTRDQGGRFRPFSALVSA
ncbi:MAG: site-specific integrase [Nitrospira sp.]|nr:site-specific integrase [Nitrospira sp.]